MPGEGVQIFASALEIYNENLVDLAMCDRMDTPKLKIGERIGKDGGIVPEVS